MRFAAIAAFALLAACAPEPSTPAAETTPEAAAETPVMNAAQTAYAVANARMHAAMGDTIPADADEAFLAGMIPHHQGAIDMANVVLEHGKDPKVRALAEAIIAAQKAEIAEMQSWLAERGTPVAAAGGAAEGATAEPMDHDAMDHAAMGH
ncbi:CopM family metallochaperone [Polymorphobacter sp.]|uniref:CopM family metallochaperone n=1 Tax=Polymorphobacter sp. TaxID=1909290 RepID=UPI003F6FD6E1